MLLTFAAMASLMGQDISLNADATQAAGCGQALGAVAPADSSAAISTMLQRVYFIMSAADADPGKEGKRFLDRVGEIAPAVFDKDAPAAPQAKATLAACDKRYPLARSTTSVKLPGDAFDRDLLCVSASAFSFGILSGADLGDQVKDYERVQDAYVGRISDGIFAAHGLNTDEEINAKMDNVLRSSLRIGNLQTIMAACTRNLDAK